MPIKGFGESIIALGYALVAACPRERIALIEGYTFPGGNRDWRKGQNQGKRGEVNKSFHIHPRLFEIWGKTALPRLCINENTVSDRFCVVGQTLGAGFLPPPATSMSRIASLLPLGYHSPTGLQRAVMSPSSSFRDFVTRRSAMTYS